MAESEQIYICTVVLIGLPGSGKSTLSKALSDYFESRNNVERNIVYSVFPVCYDELIPVDSDKWQEDWKNGRKNVLKYVSELIRCLKSIDECSTIDKVDLLLKDKLLAIKNCSSYRRVYIIIDDNMYYRSMRYEYYQLARLYNISFCQLYLECSINVALIRNSTRTPNAVVPEEVILKMADKLEAPNDRNSWEQLSLTVAKQWHPERIEEICEFLNEAATSPVEKCYNLEQHAESRAICLSSVLHQSDIALRKLVGVKMKECRQSGFCSEELETRAKLLADVRNHIMNGIKAERIEVPEDIQEGIKLGHSESRQKLMEFLNSFFVLHQL